MFKNIKRIICIFVVLCIVGINLNTLSASNVKTEGFAVTKNVTSDTGDKFEIGSNLTYTINVKNNNFDNTGNYDVPVNDDLIMNLPDYLEISSSPVIDGSVNGRHKGNLEDGTLELFLPMGEYATIEYQLKVKNNLPSDVKQITNNVFVNNATSETCQNGIDCASAVIQRETSPLEITKTVSDSTGNGTLGNNEIFTYHVTIKNPNNQPLTNVKVHDSLLENNFSDIKYNNDIVINSQGSYSGSLIDGTLKFDQIEVNEEISITYSYTNLKYEQGIIKNNFNVGETSVTTCGGKEECASAEIDQELVIGAPEVTKEQISPENTIKKGDKLAYQIKIENNLGKDINNQINLKDTLLENTPSYLSYNNDLKIEGLGDTTVSGNLETGDFNLSKMKDDQVITITYSFTVGMIPVNVDHVINKVTIENIGDDMTHSDQTNTEIAKAGISLSKVDQNGKVLAGAEFTIYDGNNNEVDNMVTDQSGNAVSMQLPLGEYTIKETKAPTGYELSTPVFSEKVVLEEKGQVYKLNEGNGIVNKQQIGKIDLYKVDQDNNPLAGAEFTIFDKEGNAIEVVTTDDNGYAVSSDLPYGEYIVTETKAPEGYKNANYNEEVIIDKPGQKITLNEGNGIENKKNEPWLPIDPSEPVEPWLPIEPSEPVEPWLPLEPSKPVTINPTKPVIINPSDPIEINPSDAIEPWLPINSSDSTKPWLSIESIKPVVIDSTKLDKAESKNEITDKAEKLIKTGINFGINFGIAVIFLMIVIGFRYSIKK